MLLEKELSTTTSQKRSQACRASAELSPARPARAPRLRPEATSVRLNEKAIHEIVGLPIQSGTGFFRELRGRRSPKPEIAGPLIREIDNRLQFLEKVGVGYLTLDRPADSLSGGELQRVRLGHQHRLGLVGVCYILDEPSIGLHHRDNQRLIEALRDLQQAGQYRAGRGTRRNDDAPSRSTDRHGARSGW